MAYDVNTYRGGILTQIWGVFCGWFSLETDRNVHVSYNTDFPVLAGNNWDYWNSRLLKLDSQNLTDSELVSVLSVLNNYGSTIELEIPGENKKDDWIYAFTGYLTVHNLPVDTAKIWAMNYVKLIKAHYPFGYDGTGSQPTVQPPNPTEPMQVETPLTEEQKGPASVNTNSKSKRNWILIAIALIVIFILSRLK